MPAGTKGKTAQSGIAADQFPIQVEINSTSLTSLGVSANSFIVFGGIKSTGTQGGRDRILDGLIDQIEIYDYALDQAEIRDRLDAVTVPEPASLALWTCGIFGLLAARQFRRKREDSHPL